MGKKSDGVAREYIAKAREALARRDLRALAELVPSREHWRLYPDFAEDALYFDIEATDGKSSQLPTVVSLSTARGCTCTCSAGTWTSCRRRWRAAAVGVFNGTCFDAPVLRDYFGERRFPSRTRTSICGS